MRHIIIPSVRESTEWNIGDEACAIGISEDTIWELPTLHDVSVFAWKILVIKPGPMINGAWCKHIFDNNGTMDELFVWWHRTGGGMLENQGRADLLNRWLDKGGPGSCIPSLLHARWEAYSKDGAGPNEPWCAVIGNIRSIVGGRAANVFPNILLEYWTKLDKEAIQLVPQQLSISQKISASGSTFSEVSSEEQYRETGSASPIEISSSEVVRRSIRRPELNDIKKVFQMLLFPLAVDVLYFSEQNSSSDWTADWKASIQAYDEQLELLGTEFSSVVSEFLQDGKTPDCPAEIAAYSILEQKRTALVQSFTAQTAGEYISSYRRLGEVLFPALNP